MWGDGTREQSPSHLSVTAPFTQGGLYATAYMQREHGTRGKRAICLCNKVVSGEESPRRPAQFTAQPIHALETQFTPEGQFILHRTAEDKK